MKAFTAAVIAATFDGEIPSSSGVIRLTNRMSKFPVKTTNDKTTNTVIIPMANNESAVENSNSLLFVNAKFNSKWVQSNAVYQVIW